jgi:hypothetical protein
MSDDPFSRLAQSVDELIFQRDQWKIEAGKLKAERDEARRMYCGRVSRDVPLDAFDIAKNHGWDCFQQEDESCQ